MNVEAEKFLIVFRAEQAQPMQCAQCNKIHPWPSDCWPPLAQAVCWSCVYADLQADHRAAVRYYRRVLTALFCVGMILAIAGFLRPW